MTVIKGLYFWATNSQNFLAGKIEWATDWVIRNTYVFPIDRAWEWISPAPVQDILALYAQVMPPAGVFLVCMFFVTDYRNTKAEYRSLLREAERERNLRELKEEMGEQTVNSSASIEVVVSQSQSRKPLWHERAWGKIAIGVIIALIVTAIGLK